MRAVSRARGPLRTLPPRGTGRLEHNCEDEGDEYFTRRRQQLQGREGGAVTSERRDSSDVQPRLRRARHVTRDT